ncbi:DUF971 domain-containing protein [Rhizobacter sp. Root1221]|uniref:DUF971 domain-containing protein n=1 Tax=Rhizobacter sp. Root1221 TaxID=1736433 RepID=UPI0006FD69A2|nr:DUF971 domain-containing protein [Rhizobacter sp. Root1221]KQV86328.1 hypothetical protein ASC87_29590 [Rhizobacter sp. Root1221]
MNGLPEAVEVARGALRLRWEDQSTTEWPATRLRAECRCGDCRSLRLAGRAPTGDGAELTGAEPVGRYALQLLFRDGHDRGIYPWDWLRNG